MNLPSRTQAQSWLTWAEEQNPGPWGTHSRGVAMMAERIAKVCGMDPELSYLSGLLHDIGRFAGVRQIHHAYAGYAFLMDQGYPELARICITHNFPVQNVETYIGQWDVTDEQRSLIERELCWVPYDDYDRLIQLCDAISYGSGVCLMEKRLVDVTRRYGFYPATIENWDAFFAIKDAFEARIGASIYSLFENVYENSIQMNDKETQQWRAKLSSKIS